jgi:hypothetical protein
MENDIKCIKTGKLLTGYNGEISLDPKFTDPTRVYSYKDCQFSYSEGFEINNLIDDFIEREGHGEIDDLFPKIKIGIETPFKKVEFGEELQSIEFDYSQKIDDLFDDGFNSQADDAYELFNDIANGRVPEYKCVPFYELHIKTNMGKYRGYMKINFSSILTQEDLKKAVYEKALEEYNFDEDVEDCLSGIPYAPHSISGVVKSSILFEDELDAYMEDLKYLLAKGRGDDIVELFTRFRKNGFNLDSELDFGRSGKKTVRAFISNLKDQKEEFIELLAKIN